METTYSVFSQESLAIILNQAVNGNTQQRRRGVKF